MRNQDLSAGLRYEEFLNSFIYQMRSILGNFGFINKNVKEIETEIRDDVDE